MKFCLQEFLESISITLDFIEMDLLNDVTFHNKKVAYISKKTGSRLGLSEDGLLTLTSCALLHDVGKGTSSYKRKSASDMKSESIKEHCVQGQAIIDILPIENSKDIVLYHHEAWDGSGVFGLKESQIPLFSQIIHLADAVEQRLQNNLGRKEIRQWVSESREKIFSNSLVDAFLEASAPPAFWIDLSPLYIENAARLPRKYIDADWNDIRRISQAFTGIVDMKSVFTARHSSGLSEKALVMGKFYNFDSDRLNQFIIAANLHDLGKLAIPNSILDKPGKLDEDEFEIIQSHTYYTRKALEKITGFEKVTEWASNHHEKLTGKGYPYGLMELDFESRLMSILDIYQALTEDRPYREGLGHEKSMEIINKLSQSGGLDGQILQDVNTVFQKG